MNLKCLINGIEYENITQGNTFFDEFNETLDSANIIINHVEKIENLLPYDDVYIYDNSLEGPNQFYKHLLINNFNYDRLNAKEFDGNKIYYNYTIELFSETKKLETIQLPNISITQPAEFGNRKTISGKVKTVWFYLEQFVDMYNPLIKVLGNYKDENGKISWTYQKKYTLDENLKSIFENVYAPSFSLNNPNLRDILTQLMNVKDIIPYVQDNVIKGLDISKTYGNFNKKGITKISGSRTSENHCDGLKRTYNNALSQENTCKTVEFLSFRNSDSSIMTLSNMRIETRFPIYKINKIHLCYYKKGYVSKHVGSQKDAVFLCKQDITPLVKLNAERQLLNQDWSQLHIHNEPKSIEDMAKYKMCTVGYDIGSRYITGWYDKYSYLNSNIAWWNKEATNLENIVTLLDKIYPLGIYYRKYFENIGGMTDSDAFYPNKSDQGFFGNYINPFDGGNIPNDNYFSVDTVGLKGLFFIVEYEGFFNGTIIHSKDNARNDIIMNDNSSSSLTVLEKDGLFQKEKVNRFGNEAVVIWARYDNINDLQNIGTKFEDDVIIYHREYAVYDNFITATYYGTKDYVLKNYFTTVFSKHRPYNLLSYEESVIRAENRKMFLIFSKDELFYENENKIFDFDITKILSFFTQNPAISQDKNFLSYPDKINYGYLTVKGEKYASDINTFVSGNSLCFNISMYDNVSGGVYISVREPDIVALGDTKEDYSGSIQDWYLTVDNVETGFLEKAGFYFSHKMTDDFFENSIAVTDENTTIDDIIDKIRSEIYSKIFFLPKIIYKDTEEINKIGAEFTINKDNKEVIDMTYQIEPISNDKNFCFSSWMMKLCDLLSIYDKFNENNLINTTTSEVTYDVYYSTFVAEKGVGKFILYNPLIIIKMSVERYNLLKTAWENAGAPLSVEMNIKYNVTADSNYYEPAYKGYTSIETYNFQASSLEFYPEYFVDGFILNGVGTGSGIAWEGLEYINFYKKDTFLADDAPEELTKINFHKIFGTTSDDTVYFVNCQIRGINYEFYPDLHDFGNSFSSFTFMATNNKQVRWDKELNDKINTEIGSNIDYYFDKVNLSVYDIVGQEEKKYNKNLFVVLDDNEIQKHMVYDEYSDLNALENFTVTNLRADEVFSVNKHNELDKIANYISINLNDESIDLNNKKSIQLWYYTNGLYKFVVGSNISEEDKQTKEIKIYVSILSNKDDRIFKQENTNWIPIAKPINYLEEKNSDYVFGSYQMCELVNGTIDISKGFVYTFDGNKNYLITNIGTCNDSDIILPDMYQGIIISEISENVFKENNELNSIKISDTIEVIGISCFEGCNNLKNVILSENSSLKTIDVNSFKNCEKLEEINLSKNVTYVNNFAFYGCKTLTKVHISDKILSIGEQAFANCESLAEVKFKDIQQNEEPTGTISSYAFNGCLNLKEILISGNINIIDNSAFEENSSLEKVIIGDKVSSIKNSAFYGCENLEEVVIGKSVKELGESCFSNCSKLKEINIPKSLKEINVKAFENCSSLTNINIPKTVEIIGANAFKGCRNLTIYCEYSSKPDGWDIDWNPDNLPVVWANTINDDLKYQLKDDNTYEIIGLINENVKDLIIPKLYKGIPVTSIADNAFVNCINLIKLEFEKNIKSIGNNAFFGCNKLKFINITNSLENMGENVFKYCNNLTIFSELEEKPSLWNENWNPDDRPVVWNYNGSIGLEFTLEYNKYVISSAEYCKQNEIILIPEKLNDIVVYGLGDNLFKDFTNLKNVGLTTNINYIGSSAFENCSGLSSIILSDEVINIGANAFKGCSNLSIFCEPMSKPYGWDENWNPDYLPVVWDFSILNMSLKDDDTYEVVGIDSTSKSNLLIPDFFDGKKVTSIGENAFKNDNNIQVLKFVGNIKEIKKSAFEGCSNLNKIYFPSYLEKIGDRAFANNTSLIYIDLTNGINELGESSFEGCSELKAAMLPNNLKVIKQNAFKSCPQLAIYSKHMNEQENWDMNWNSDNNYVYWDFVPSNGLEFSQLGDTVIGFGSCTDLKIVVPPVYNEKIITAFSPSYYDSLEFRRTITSVVLPSTIIEIGDYALASCFELTSVLIPNNVEKIGDFSFLNCNSLENIILPNNLNTIGQWAFDSCSALNSIIIPQNVENIGKYAFLNCSNLTIYCEVLSKPSTWDQDWNPSSRPVVWNYKK